MDYTTLPSKTSLMSEEENLQMGFSLYEALQELPDARRAEAQTLFVSTHPLVSHSREIGWTEECKWSDRMASSSASGSCTMF